LGLRIIEQPNRHLAQSNKSPAEIPARAPKSSALWSEAKQQKAIASRVQMLYFFAGQVGLKDCEGSRAPTSLGHSQNAHTDVSKYRLPAKAQ
jgi:hypothetical protein